MSYQSKVKRHAESSGTASHFERDPDGVRVEISYTVYDCKYCGEEGISSKANFDTWEEVWISVEDHLKLNHPEKLEK